MKSDGHDRKKSGKLRRSISTIPGPVSVIATNHEMRICTTRPNFEQSSSEPVRLLLVSGPRLT